MKQILEFSEREFKIIMRNILNVLMGKDQKTVSKDREKIRKNQKKVLERITTTTIIIQ